MSIKACSLSSPQTYGHVAVAASVVLAATAVTLFCTMDLAALPTALLAAGSVGSGVAGIALYSCGKNSGKNRAENNKKSSAEENPPNLSKKGNRTAPQTHHPHSQRGSSGTDRTIEDVGSKRPPSKERNIEIFKDTRRITKVGHYINSKGTPISFKNDQVRTSFYYGDRVKPPCIPLARPNVATGFAVTQEDSLDAAIRLAYFRVAQGNSFQIPLVLSMANATHPGGRVGASTQEESLCRRTTLFEGLESVSQGNTYNIPQYGGVYSPGVAILKDSEGNLYDQILLVNIASVAAFDLNPQHRSNVRNTFTNKRGEFDEAFFVEETKIKIRNLLRNAYAMQNRDLILGALGCGAFKNDPDLVARCFYEVFSEEEFRGAFYSVTFAIKGNDPTNFNAFQRYFPQRQ